ncbi:MAG: hypothetical protein ACK4WB_00905, partial [Desulfatiglandales bacterium]
MRFMNPSGVKGIFSTINCLLALTFRCGYISAKIINRKGHGVKPGYFIQLAERVIEGEILEGDELLQIV